MLLSGQEKTANDTPWRNIFMNNNCFCHLFDDNCTWIIIAALIVVLCCCCNG